MKLMNIQLLLKMMTWSAEEETLNYVLQEMAECFGDEMPDEKEVRSYLRSPDRKTILTLQQQLVAMDKLLEWAEINFRTSCDLIRYQHLKAAGVVNSMDEFLELFRGGQEA
jgi:hypothetical protein